MRGVASGYGTYSQIFSIFDKAQGLKTFDEVIHKNKTRQNSGPAYHGDNCFNQWRGLNKRYKAYQYAGCRYPAGNNGSRPLRGAPRFMFY
ncbi:MAG: hypothetical protein LBR99_01170 [Treponema sp.]|jgi:hypothetical protein|nr:hypothetical protein [Treponema sp.]